MRDMVFMNQKAEGVIGMLSNILMAQLNGTLICNIKNSYKHIPYTLKHKVVMLSLERKYTGRNTLRVYLHDVDKILCYVFFPFLSTKTHKRLHRKIAKHHHYWEIHRLSMPVKREIVLDWESGRYTKNDKPYNAREWCMKMRPECFPYLESVFIEWGL